MKKIIFFVAFLILFNIVYSQLIISSNTTWSGSYFVSQKVIVNQNVTLTIEPSTIVSLGYVDANGDNIGDVEIEVNGKIVIKGAPVCSPVKFIPFTSSANKNYWKGIKINSNTVNDSIFGVEISNAETPFNVLTSAKINNCVISNFGNRGIYFNPTIAGTELTVNATKLFNGQTAIYQTGSNSSLFANWIDINQCKNGIIGFNGNLKLKSSLVYSCERLGVAYKDGNVELYNSKVKNNYAFGLFNSSSNFTVYKTEVDSNSLGGVLMAGLGNNNIQYSNIRNNKGAQIEVTNYGFNIDTSGVMSSYGEGNPTIVVNNNNILGDTLSTITDNLGLFDMPSNASGSCWANQGCNLTNSCSTNGTTGNSSPLIYKTPLGRLAKFWVAYGASLSSNILTRCFNLNLRDEGSNSNLGGTSNCAGPSQYLQVCISNPSQGGTFIVTPTYEMDKYLFVNSTGNYGNFSVSAAVNKAYYLFGGDLLFNNIRPDIFNTPPSFNFQNNNFGQPILTNYFFDQTNQAINYQGYTVFSINGAGIQYGNQLLSLANFPDVFLNTTSGSDTICSGQNQYLFVQPVNNANYNWYLNDNLFAVTSSNQYLPPASGSWYCVISSTGCTIKSSVRNIFIANNPTITYIGNTSICSGQSTSITVSGANAYIWSNGSSGNSQVLSPSSNTSYTVTGQTNGCSSSLQIPIIVNALPTPTISPYPSAILCAGSNLILNAGGGNTYLWVNGATTQSVSISSPGVYSVLVTNANGCSAYSQNTTIISLTAPIATITAGSSTTFCQGGSVILSANTGTGLTYQWKNNGTNITGATSSTYTATASGSYALVVTNSNNCSATSTATAVTVNALPIATNTPAGSTTFCQGNNVVLNANTGSGLSYQWTLNGSNIGAATAAAYTANASGNYAVIVTNTATCSVTSSATIVTVNALPVATTSAGSATTFCIGGSVTLNANIGTGLTYQWKNSGTDIIGEISTSYMATASGLYAVLVINSNGCTATSTATTVTVNTPPTATNTAAGATTFCQGNNVVLNANTGSGLSYQWTLNGANINGSTAASYTANASGNYAVVVTNSNTCTATSTATAVTVNALPTATNTAAGATTFCQGNNVVLNANTGTGLTYQWTLNGANINGSTAASYTANASGNYAVIVTNAATCLATSTATTVTVNTLPTATNTAAGTTTFCQGANVVLNANTGTGLTYQWTLNGSNINGSTASSYTANASGNYAVIVTNAATCTATSTATSVTVNAPPTATNTPAGTTTFCQGNNVVLNANTGTGLTYQWTLNGANISGSTAASYTANASGNYAVIVTNSNTCAATSTATTVTVNALPTSTITPVGTTNICQGNNVVFNANTGTGLTYQWTINGANISGSTAGSYTANASGNYAVIVTNSNTCTATSTATTVTVNALPPATISAGGTTTFCTGGSVTLTASAGSSYLWSNSATSQVITVSTAGNYSVVVTDVNACSAASSVTSVTVNTLPTVTLGTITSPVCDNSPFIALLGNPTGGVYSGTGVSGSNFDPAVSGAGTFNVLYTYIDGNSCSANATQSVVVDLCTGIVESTNGLISIYPNPANDLINVSLDASILNHTTIEIYDAIGKLVISEKAASKNTSIKISSLVNGIYSVKVISDGKQQAVNRFVKQ